MADHVADNHAPSREQQILLSLLSDLQDAKERIEVQSKELHAANAKLRDSAALKDEFVAKVSHELRTPLTSIKEGLSLMLDGALGETTADQRDFLATMDADIDRLAELINNILDISKIEAGRMRLMRARLDLAGIVESMIRSYQPILGRRTVRNELSGAPTVFADANRIRQIFANLFANALKFTEDTGTIRFRAEARGDFLAVFIEDTGCGIAAEDMPKLFQKFSQVGPQGSGRPRGTGLGLAVCKELVELHQGKIEVASVPGQGTTFIVLLPLYSDAVALQESVREMLHARVPGEADAVGLIAVQAAGAVQDAPDDTARRLRLERVAETIRHCLHRDDVVLTILPSWIAIIALADEPGLQAMVKRLREAVPHADQLLFGAAQHPGDHTTAAALFDAARAAVPDGRVPQERQP